MLTRFTQEELRQMPDTQLVIALLEYRERATELSRSWNENEKKEKLGWVHQLKMEVLRRLKAAKKVK